MIVMIRFKQPSQFKKKKVGFKNCWAGSIVVDDLMTHFDQVVDQEREAQSCLKKCHSEHLSFGKRWLDPDFFLC